MKKAKQILSWLLALCMVLGMAPAIALTASAEDGATETLSIPEDFVIREDGVYEVGEVNQEVTITDNAREVTLIGSKTADEPYTGLRFTSQVTEGLHLTIENLHISNNVSSTYSGRNPICFAGTGNVLTLVGESSFTAPDGNYVGRAHIGVPKDAAVTINGEGTANFYMGISTTGACIGGDAQNNNAGSVTVESGTLNFTLKGKGAGIGGATSRSINQVTIAGGTLNFDIPYAELNSYSNNKDYSGAGIGTGSYVTSYNGSSAPNIIIKGGTITGTTETCAPIIGVTGSSDVGATITITGGKLNLKSTRTDDNAASCIGTSKSVQGSATILISGGEIVAEAAGSAAAIGSGYRAAAGSITIKGGTVTASNTCTAKTVPAIGPGSNGTAGTVTISGGSVKAESASTDAISSSSGVVNADMEAVSLYVMELPGVKSVTVDGVDWKVSANHPDDDNLYLWLTEGEHDIVTDPVPTKAIPEDFIIREDGVYSIGDVNQEVRIIEDAREVTLIGAKTADDPYTGLRFTSEITEGLHLTIENLHISNSVASTYSGRNPICFAGTGNVLTLVGENSFYAPDGVYVGRAHIGVPKGAALTINGEGSADFYMGIKTTGACIGGDAQNANAGTVIIEGGTLNFTVKGKGAGIGGASSRSIDQVTVKGGTLNINCTYTEYTDWSTTNNLADCGAGIGTGYYVTNYNGSTAPNILITGGTINGLSETAAPLIGVTQSSNVGATITISGGKLNLKSTATGTDAGACIGTSRSVSVAPSITINGGEIVAEVNGLAAAIGSGANSAAGNLYIYGGTITAISNTTTQSIPAIGAGYMGTAGTVWISGGSVKAVSASTDGIATSSAVVNSDLDPVYLNVFNVPDVKYVYVDGVDWKVSANHPEDDNIYLWLTEGEHTYDSDPMIHLHSFGEWIVTTEPTCTETGVETRTCDCGEFETREVAVLGHNYEAVVTEPTCTEGGYTTYTCSRCEDSYVADETPANGHSYGEWAITTEPTCTETGVETRTCDCGEFETREVAALGHTEVTDAAVAPTCTEAGLTEGAHCDLCGEVLTAQEVVAALGHDWSDWEVVTKVTCQADGEQKHSCTRCDAEETEVIAKYDCPSAAYTDVVADAWYHDAVDYMVMNGLMNGMSPTSFAPEGTLTRAQLVTVLYRIAGEPEVEDTASFEDVEAGLWYTDAIAWAKANGVVNGTSETTFSPDEAITREQIAAILYRYTKSEPVEEDFLKDFPDAASVSSYALDAMNWAVSVGLIGGSDGELLPLSNATRAQIATILMRWLEK